MPGKEWVNKTNEEQCLLLGKFIKAIEVTPQFVQSIREKISKECELSEQQSKIDSEMSETISLVNQKTEKDGKIKQQIPSYFCCYLTGKLMHEPVFISSGGTYDRLALIEHFKANGHTDPLTK